MHFNKQPGCLIEPYGGSLVSSLVPTEERAELVDRAAYLPRLQLTSRSLCDLELLATGGFSPLTSFLGEKDYEYVLETMRLKNGVLFPIPITLSVAEEPWLRLDSEIALADERNNLLAVMRVEEIYAAHREREARLVYGTTDPRHPIVAEMNSWGKLNISGTLKVINLPAHYDFRELRLTPAQVREKLIALEQHHVVAFQTRNPLHRAHEELTKRAAAQINGALLIHPTAGVTKPGDIDHYTRVRSYKILAERYYDPRKTLLALLPLAMRMGGPREAVWHGLIRRNFGADHFIVGRDHASPGNDSQDKPFYGPYDAQELFALHSGEMGMRMIPFKELVYLPDEERYEERTRITRGSRIASLSGTAIRETYLQRGRSLPPWFTRPEIADVLAQTYPPRYQQGFCVWFTGLSGAGKSTTAEVLISLLLEHGRQLTELDGDVVRTHLSKGLGFSREDRDINIRRIGFVAAEIVRHGGAVVTAAVSPYRATRNECRQIIGDDRFIEIHVKTSLEVCEKRDPKGMYARARSGQIKGFTGIDDPYEEPLNPAIVLDTVNFTAEENARRILAYLIAAGFVMPHWSPEMVDEKESSELFECEIVAEVGAA